MNSEQERLISADRAGRRGWVSAFAASSPVREEIILDPALSNRFDVEDWEW
jgi:hypothetical protein